MKANLLGFKHNQGEFEGRKYDNYKLYLSGTLGTADVYGDEVMTLKVSTAVFDNYVVTTDGTLEDILGNIEINLGLNNKILSIAKVKE